MWIPKYSTYSAQHSFCSCGDLEKDSGQSGHSQDTVRTPPCGTQQRGIAKGVQLIPAIALPKLALETASPKRSEAETSELRRHALKRYNISYIINI